MDSFVKAVSTRLNAVQWAWVKSKMEQTKGTQAEVLREVVQLGLELQANPWAWTAHAILVTRPKEPESQTEATSHEGKA